MQNGNRQIRIANKNDLAASLVWTNGAGSPRDFGFEAPETLIL